ncbi:MAG: DUF4876 domain-containing protein [Bacteroidaceae bacterium]|nr:DUF4876 domain-containing protein [Bacteroidaceae bacterium]
MRKLRGIVTQIMAFCAFCGIMTACSSSDDSVSALSITVQVSAPENAKGLELSGKTVTITGENRSYTGTTDEGGKAVIGDVIPGVYTVSTSWDITSEQYMAATGETVQNGKYIVGGSAASQTLSQNTSIALALTVSVKQSMLISKVYYSGCKDANSKNYLAGRFIELYNNGDEAVNIAGMYIGLTESESTPAYVISTKSDTIFLKQVFQIPTDKEYMVAPGQNVVIANSAIDHTSDGADIYNLSSATFEAKDEQGKTTNNPKVPALNLIYSAYAKISQMNLLQSGPTGVVIFNTNEDVTAWREVFAEGKEKGSKFKTVPSKSVIDGVDILTYKTGSGIDVATKRLYDYIDAGYLNVEAITSYTGMVAYRKLQSKTDDGRAILKDTNNSTEDWAVASREEALQPGVYK